MFQYPWDRWFSYKKKFRLSGKDYRCGPQIMAQQIRNAACRRGLSVGVHVEGEVITVEVRR